jgi:hypothetical protein
VFGLALTGGVVFVARILRPERSKVMPIAMSDSNADLRALLETLDPKARDDLRRVLIRDQADRDAIASKLLRYRDGHGDDWADIIDMLTLYPDARRRVVRLLGESRGFLT